MNHALMKEISTHNPQYAVIPSAVVPTHHNTRIFSVVVKYLNIACVHCLKMNCLLLAASPAKTWQGITIRIMDVDLDRTISAGLLVRNHGVPNVAQSFYFHAL